MKRCSLAPALLLSLGVVSCKPPVQITPAPATASAAEIKLTGASVMLGVGDIARCGVDGDERTAHLVDSMLRADSVAKVTVEVFTLGDNAYPDGSASNFALCFTPSWGDTAKRIMKKIHPAVGNHEYVTVGSSPYYQYFGTRAGPNAKGYYSYDVGEWHVSVLNSELVVAGFTLAEQKAQEDWLRADLKGTTKPCTMAYWHHPRFSSGWHGNNLSLSPLWQILFDGGVTLVMNGHDHEYERFLPQTPAGVLDTINGMAEYVVGTGGGDLRGFAARRVANSASQIQGYYGVLKLTLGKGEYSSAFVDVNGRMWDPSGGKCRPKTAAPKPAP
jgi:hypothetical protein